MNPVSFSGLTVNIIALIVMLFLRVDCEHNRPSFLATVFQSASAFNGDVNQWNVANVNNMQNSKSILIVED